VMMMKFYRWVRACPYEYITNPQVSHSIPHEIHVSPN
jgi:hypothetical protein